MERRSFNAVVSAVALVVALLSGTGAAVARTGSGGLTDGTYIVQLAELPVVAYDGRINGFKATKPAKGEKIDPAAPDVVRYAGHLSGRHDALLRRTGGDKVYDYKYSFNGFAARMSAAEAARALADPAVLSVEKTREVTADTATTPDFLGLTKSAAEGGLWAKGITGEDIVIGVLDSGIWPENPSFSDRDANGKLVYKPLSKFSGKCASSETTDESWDANLCNKKLVAAQFFCASRGCDTVLDHEFLSPRDYNGHGTHTAGTAGGNRNVATNGDAALFGKVSGIAPRARIAAYKVCWDNGAGGCGSNSGDAVAAIDQAVADGVDVINYSISGTSTNYLDSVEVAYLFAADAGVFVATSAGNSGPGASTVAHISPWLASVAAGTHNRSGTATVTLGNGATYTGASLTDAVGPAQLVRSTQVGKDGANANEVALCFLGTLDPAKAAGKIVQCDRGVNARVDKSAAVKEAGGVGMVLTNTAASSLNADLHTVPTVHLAHTDRPAILAYIESAGAAATASLSKAVVNTNAPAPEVAAFSSRGPSLAGGGDILKPDFMLPGVDVLAAISPAGNDGKDFDLLSGTSMSSPHVAGVAALLSQAKGSWSPAAMRSAMATTAHQQIVGGYNPFGAGSGQVQPNRTVDPGLVYDADFADYLAFLKGQGLCCAANAAVQAIDASDLNQPSLAVGDLAGVQTLRRTVTNVGTAAATYIANVAAPAGTSVVVTPASFTIAPGASQDFTVTITRTTATLNAYAAGSLTWNDGTHSVFSPIVVRPVAIAAPGEVSGSGASGETSWTIRTGYAGELSYAIRGLVPAATTTGTVVDDPTDDFDTDHPDDNQGITTHDVVVPADSVAARFSLFDEFTDGADDLDLYVYRVANDGTKTFVGNSGSGTSAEQVHLANPVAGTYRVYVHGWQTDGPDAQYTLFSWVLGTAAAGNLTASGPTVATIGGSGTVTAAWSGLSAGKYLGQIAYQQGTTTHGSTLVRVDVP